MHAHTRREVDPARAVEHVRKLFTQMAPLSRTPFRLVNNGCDHFPPQHESCHPAAPHHAARPPGRCAAARSAAAANCRNLT